jgi:uncharacterized tellurite resistance protein B-like protein
MFAELIARLTHPRPAPLPDLDARRALGALLVRVAKADASYAVEEIRRIDRILGASFGLNPVAAARLRAEAERLEHVAPEDGRFAAAVAAAVPQEARESVLAALWQVALADGAETPEELAYVHRVAERLGLDVASEARSHDRAAGSAGTIVPDLGPPQPKR